MGKNKEEQPITAKDIFEGALLEIRNEKIEKAKVKVKDKLRLLDQAEKVVSNLKREISELQFEIQQDLEG